MGKSLQCNGLNNQMKVSNLNPIMMVIIGSNHLIMVLTAVLKAERFLMPFLQICEQQVSAVFGYNCCRYRTVLRYDRTLKMDSKLKTCKTLL